MTRTPPVDPTARGAFCLYSLFFFSGISGLIYEFAWTRILGHILGNTVYATSTILAAFMAGLALGGFLIGRFIDKVKNPLLIYALLEAGIGVSAWASLGLSTWPVPLYRVIYRAAGESRGWLTVGQVIIAALVLLLPTMLMGSTLPTLTIAGKLLHRRLGRHIGVLYALNTLGATFGVILSGFILLGAIGETRTILVGVTINALVTVGALLMHFLAEKPPGAPVGAASDATGASSMHATPVLLGAHVSSPPASNRGRISVLVVFALAGFVALASEVIWTRLFLLCLGTSIYAFSAILLRHAGRDGHGQPGRRLRGRPPPRPAGRAGAARTGDWDRRDSGPLPLPLSGWPQRGGRPGLDRGSCLAGVLAGPAPVHHDRARGFLLRAGISRGGQILRRQPCHGRAGRR